MTLTLPERQVVFDLRGLDFITVGKVHMMDDLSLSCHVKPSSGGYLKLVMGWDPLKVLSVVEVAKVWGVGERSKH